MCAYVLFLIYISISLTFYHEYSNYRSIRRICECHAFPAISTSLSLAARVISRRVLQKRVLGRTRPAEHARVRPSGGGDSTDWNSREARQSRSRAAEIARGAVYTDFPDCRTRGSAIRAHRHRRSVSLGADYIRPDRDAKTPLPSRLRDAGRGRCAFAPRSSRRKMVVKLRDVVAHEGAEGAGQRPAGRARSVPRIAVSHATHALTHFREEEASPRGIR